MTTTEEENKQLVRDLVEAMDERDLDRLDELLADDFVSHNPAAEDIDGPAEYKDFVAMFDAGFPDARHVHEDILSEGDKVVQRNRLTGTHEGEFMGIGPTGNEIDVPGIVVYRIEDGQIAEQWVQSDMMGMMDQLGVA